MSMVTDALVLKVSDVGESDRVVTLLSSEFGVIRAFANRAKKMNGKMQSATQALCYGTYTIYTGKDSYIISDAAAKEVFFGLRNNIEHLALAQYFCSLAIELIPEGEPAPMSLRVILNSLSFLQSERRSCEFIKAVTELKLLTLAGFAPDVAACSGCGSAEGGAGRFNMNSGRFYCTGCMGSGESITPGILAAMRHIVFSPVERIYSFTLPDAEIKKLSEISENFLINITGKKYKTLDFYKTVIL